MEQNDRGTFQLNIDLACVECIINQSRRVGDTLGVDTKTKEALVAQAKLMSGSFDFKKTPPEVATPVYEAMTAILKTDDIYREIKERSTKMALSFLPYLRDVLQSSEDLFLSATKMAVAGNVIDLASEVSFSLDEELEKIFCTDFAIDDTRKLRQLLQEANDVVVLGDNAGEHLFDKLYIETLQKLFPHITFRYFVRTKPIINDVTLKEAREIDFDEVCEVIDSGVDMPGFVYEIASKEAKNLFDDADVIISKGMGNYECLSPSHKSPIAFLLKVKCNVVANSLGKNVGDIICKIW